MSDLQKSLEGLSPKKRELFELLQKRKKEETPRPQRISRRTDLTRTPLSFEQQRLWFLSQFAPESPVYNVATAYRLTGDLKVERLAAALNTVVNRHDVLRSRYVTEGGEPTQVIDPPRDKVLDVVDLSEMSEQEKYDEALRQMSADATTAFDLAVGPLFRAVLYRYSTHDYALYLNM